ncbi:MAG TPA: hypothetical protein VKZ97_02655 [Flavobacteriaceae bacterium]|nr:hypothetical protein [Flavobacteriaceae bacterium]
MKIQDTQAFKAMDGVQQKVAVQNRSTINHSALLLKNVGTERWEKLSNHLPNRWKNIVKELAAV